jgi:hypothetical protein
MAGFNFGGNYLDFTIAGTNILPSNGLTTPFDVPVTSGVPETIQITGQIYCDGFDGSGTCGSQTAFLSDATFTDTAGNPLTGLTLVTVPESTSVVLMLTMLLEVGTAPICRPHMKKSLKIIRIGLLSSTVGLLAVPAVADTSEITISSFAGDTPISGFPPVPGCGGTVTGTSSASLSFNCSFDFTTYPGINGVQYSEPLSFDGSASAQTGLEAKAKTNLLGFVHFLCMDQG